MAIVCKQCRRPKGHGHKMDCGSSYSRRNEVWVDNVSGFVVAQSGDFLDQVLNGSSDTGSSSSYDSGSSSSSDSGSF